ncbi:MAG TPA: putative sulfate exporter family transporter [Paracoccaceae bacterium]|nr:putative sulfate exporter family transporter [Paracoccaceae bacterium]
MAGSGQGRRLRALRKLLPGLATALLVAAAASFVADTYGGPVMLLALLIGIALNFLSKGEAVGPGLIFTSKAVLRLGVALLGLRIALSDLVALGPAPLVIVVAGILVTLAAGLLLARLLARPAAFGVLIGGATAICGASAALALSGVLGTRLREREVVFAVVSVTTLSTIAMVAYPVVAKFAGLDDHLTGILLGATIHDVAQVVGAGYAVSTEAGDTATIVKLFRVAMLMPMLVAVGLAFRARRAGVVRGPGLPLPFFAIAFFLLVLVNSAGLMPEPLRLGLVELSRWCLITAVAAIGLTTSIEEMLELGKGAIVLPVATSLVLLVTVLAALILT